ncbi:hypothetical protein ACH9D2_18440 [Kocuria sp. M4R2S49]|uniref:hypothetical protein n=1 Tax=Kocuria rhizosphaericola TaxID=3376284 RepID=UPI00378E9CA6
MPNDHRRPRPPYHAATGAPPRAAGHSIVFDSPAELAAYTRHDRLTSDGPLLLARRAGYHPDGSWPCSALESAQNVLATRARTMIEIELRTTVDGRCVVLHEAVMGHGSTGAGPVSEQSADYVLSQHLVDNYGEVTRFPVREAAEFLTWAVLAGAVLWLDVRNVSPESVVELVRTHRAESQVVVGVNGLRELAVYRRIAPDLVYFVPTHQDGLPTVDDVRREVPDIRRVVGFAGHYIPDMEESLRMRSWNVPMRLELHRYDENLPADALDVHYYRRAVEAGFGILSTSHYREVADLLGLSGWAPKNASARDGRGVSRR